MSKYLSDTLLNLIASSDLDGVVKVWSSPVRGHPNTLVTFVSSSAVTALDWLSKVSDRYLLIGNTTGSLKVCDQLERKTCHELSVGAGNPVVMVEAGGANGSFVAVSMSGLPSASHQPDGSSPENF